MSTQEKTKRQRSASPTTTMRGLKTAIQNLVELELITEEELTTLETINKAVIERWIYNTLE